MADVATARPLTASQQLRKVRKPLIERKRRERINGCLNELKSLVLESLNKDEAQFSKLEKADILELALEVLKNKSHHKAAAPAAPEPSVIASKYTAGFSQCALEVARCLGSIDGVKPEVRVHLTEHLAGCVQKLAKLANSVGAGKKDNISVESPSDNSYQCPPSPAESRSSQYSCSLPSSSSESSVSIPVTSSVPVYQQLHVVGHVMTSPSPATSLSTSGSPPPQLGAVPQYHPVPSVSPPQQPHSPNQYYGNVYSQQEVQQYSGHCILKPQPVSALYQAIPASPSQNVWRPW